MKTALQLPNGRSREDAIDLLAAYDSRVFGGYKNQVIAAREKLALRCGMGVRDLRRWLADTEEQAEAEIDEMVYRAEMRAEGSW